MEHPRYILYRLLYRLREHFDENQATRIQIGLLALFYAGLWWGIGVLAGCVLAFFVFVVTPNGPERSWPAVYVLFGTIGLCGIFGTYLSWKTYICKMSDLEDTVI